MDYTKSSCCSDYLHKTSTRPSLSPSGVYTERYNRTVRYDWLGQYLFSSLSELQEYTTKWQ